MVSFDVAPDIIRAPSVSGLMCHLRHPAAQKGLEEIGSYAAQNLLPHPSDTPSYSLDPEVFKSSANLEARMRKLEDSLGEKKVQIHYPASGANLVVEEILEPTTAAVADAPQGGEDRINELLEAAEEGDDEGEQEKGEKEVKEKKSGEDR